MLNKIKLGKVYYHYKNHKPYKVVDLNIMIQKDNKWHPAIMYELLGSKNNNQEYPAKVKYVREIKEFMEKFSEK